MKTKTRNTIDETCKGEARSFNWPEVKWFSEDNKAALRTLVSIIKESTAYKNPQTTGDGFLVQAVLWLEDHNPAIRTG